MAAVAEAYRYLRAMYESRVGPGAHRAGVKKKKKMGPHSPDDVGDVHFDAPSFGASSTNTWLPWQKDQNTKSGASISGNGGDPNDVGRWESKMSDMLEDSKGFDDFVNQVRTAERRRGVFVRGDPAANDSASAAKKEANANATNAIAAASKFSLGMKFVRRKVRLAPRNFVMAARFIFMGR